MGIDVVRLDLGSGVVAKDSFDHCRDLGRGTVLQLGVDTGGFLFDVPVDHDPGAAVPVVPFGHQVRFPGAELLRIRRTRVACTPPCRVPGLKGGVDDFHDCLAEAVFGDERPADMPQLAFGLSMSAGVRDRFDAHIRAQPEQTHEQPAPERVLAKVLPRRDGSELFRAPGQEVSLLENFQQIQGTPPPDQFVFEFAQIRRFNLFFQLRHHDPRGTAALGDLDPACRVTKKRIVQALQRPGHPGSQIVDEYGRIQGLTEPLVMQFPGPVEVFRQVVLRIPPLPGPCDEDFPPA